MDKTQPSPTAWHLVTGEYPPAGGGVADYTRQLAAGLAAAGCVVHVYCRGDATDAEQEPDGVWVHRVAGRFDRAGRARLGRALSLAPPPRLVLVQYVPHAFGGRAMNLAFVAWVVGRAWRGDQVRLMFHEVAYPWVRRPLRHNLIAAVNRVMAAALLRASTSVYVSTPAWEQRLRWLGAGRLPITWTPVPSNIPGEAPADQVASRRSAIVGPSATSPVVGHFGTYGPSITQALAPVVRRLLDRRPGVRVVLLGAGGDRWRRELLADRPDWADRIVAPGPLPALTVAEYLRACDLVVQPFPDGVSSRRTTVMAALANAVPVVTTIGPLSERIWAEAPVATAPVGDSERLRAEAEALLDSPPARVALGHAGRQFYQERFALDQTIATLLAPGGA